MTEPSAPVAPARKVPETIYLLFLLEVTPLSVESLVAMCTQACAGGAKNIHLLMSTTGGNVHAGISAYGALKALPCKLITHNIGQVGSIGNVLFMAGKPRFANPGSTFVVHGAFNSINQAADFKYLSEQLESIKVANAQMADILCGNTSIPRPVVEAACNAARFLTSKEAVELGIVDDLQEAHAPEGTPFINVPPDIRPRS